MPMQSFFHNTTLGQQDALLVIKCQPGEVFVTVILPEGYSIGSINSNVKHSISGVKYRDTRIGAFMGHKIIIDYLNIKPHHDPFNGYLCNITPLHYSDKFYTILRTYILCSSKGSINACC